MTADRFGFINCIATLLLLLLLLLLRVLLLLLLPLGC